VLQSLLLLLFSQTKQDLSIHQRAYTLYCTVLYCTYVLEGSSPTRTLGIPLHAWILFFSSQKVCHHINCDQRTAFVFRSMGALATENKNMQEADRQPYGDTREWWWWWWWSHCNTLATSYRAFGSPAAFDHLPHHSYSFLLASCHIVCLISWQGARTHQQKSPLYILVIAGGVALIFFATGGPVVPYYTTKIKDFF
jgi:hypothetical protein